MLKSVLIVYNQALSDEVLRILNDLQIRGFTRMQSLQGRGSKSGEPHMGSHSWPALNDATLVIAEDAKANQLLDKISELDQEVEDQGIRAFLWGVERMV